MSALLVIGVDPGQTTGIAELLFVDGVLRVDASSVVQASPLAVVPCINALFDLHTVGDLVPTIIAAESFVVGRRASRSRAAQAGETARTILGALQDFADRTNGAYRHAAVRFVQHPAGVVKPWATDRRIEAAGLAELTTGMRHARDACRHALYAAACCAGARDPLSRKENSRG